MAAKVRKNHFSGGRGLTPRKGVGGGYDSLEDILRSIIADNGVIKEGLEITSPDATDLATAQVLVNEIKAALNAIFAAAASTTVE